MIVRLNRSCNQRCIFCNVLDGCNDLTTEEAKRIILERSGEYDSISISGGEPTLRDDLPYLIAYAKRCGIKRISLQTNGVRLFYDGYLESLKNAGLDQLFIAFHSHDMKSYDIITGTSGHYDKAVQGIKNAIGSGIPVVLNPVINSFNYRTIREYVEFIHENFRDRRGRGIKNISFSFVQPQGRAYRNREVVPRYSDVEPYLVEALDYCNDVGIEFFNPYCGFPLCRFGRYYRYSNEYIDAAGSDNSADRDNSAGSGESGDDGLVSRDRGTPGRKIALANIEDNKIKGEVCRGCRLYRYCNGIWTWYHEMYGFDDLRPLSRISDIGLTGEDKDHGRE